MTIQERIKEIVNGVVDVNTLIFLESEEMTYGDLDELVEDIPDKVLDLVDDHLYEKLDASISEVIWSLLEEHADYLREIKGVRRK